MAATELLAGCYATLTYRARREGSRVRVPAAELARLKSDGETLVVHADGLGRTIALRREAAGRVVALSLACTHRGCALEAVPEGYDCPCHGSQFDEWGAVRRGPAEAPLRRLPTTWQGDELLIAVIP